MAVIAGFTGTGHRPMSEKQKVAIYQLLERLKVTAAHHGDCVNSDADFHDILESYNELNPYHRIWTGVHPPKDPKKRAFKVPSFGVIFPEEGYLKRDKAIVDRAHFLIATPLTKNEELRSGTWATIRMARKSKIKIYLIEEDGTVNESEYNGI